MSPLDPRINPYKDGFAAEHLRGQIEAKTYGAPIRHQIVMPVVPLHQKPATTSMMDTQVLLGSLFDVYDLQGGWVWGQEVVKDGHGTVGYVPKMAVIPPRYDPTHRITSLRAPVFVKPDIKSAIRNTLPLNARLHVEHAEGEFMVCTDFGLVHKNHIAEIDAPSAVDFVTIAERHVGLPYVWGGVSPDGVDCSGLVQTALRATGSLAPRDSDLQEAALGKALRKNTALKRGDLVFWKGHVGIMTDTDTLLHANAHHMLVAKEKLVQARARIAKTNGEITTIKRL